MYTVTINENLMQAYNLLESISPMTNKMEVDVFGAFVCMLAEEWALYNKCDMLELLDDLKTTAEEVHAIAGKYEG